MTQHEEIATTAPEDRGVTVDISDYQILCEKCHRSGGVEFSSLEDDVPLVLKTAHESICIFCLVKQVVEQTVGMLVGFINNTAHWVYKKGGWVYEPPTTLGDELMGGLAWPRDWEELTDNIPDHLIDTSVIGNDLRPYFYQPDEIDILIDTIVGYLGLREAITREYLRIALSDVRLFDHKQHDRGPSNILAFGEVGVLIRVVDKIERLKRILYDKIEPVISEPVENEWADIAVYSVIARLLRSKLWK